MQIFISSSLILFKGNILEGETIAESRPALIASLRKIELRTILALVDNPKLTFEIPRITWTSGCSSLINLIAFIVSKPFFLSSSNPVEIVIARGSYNSSYDFNPELVASV